MKRFLMTSAALATLAAAPAFAEECTAELVQEKATAVNAKVQELAASNPEKIEAVMPKIEEATTRFQEGADLTEACAVYDELMAELES